MTWARAILYLAIWLILSVYYVAFERSPQVTNAPVEETTSKRLIPFAVQEVTTFTVDANGTRLRSERRAGAWQMLEPPGANVPADLVAAMVATLIELPPVDVVPAGGETGVEFGLTADSVRLILGTPSEQVRVQLGSRNPSQTAVYARREGAEEVVLVGLNVQYYVDLIIEALRGHTG